VQVPRLEDGDIAHVVSKAQNDYPETSDELRELSNAPKLKVWDESAVIQAALDWKQGVLSGSKIHELLGSESPGKRQLMTLCTRVIEQAAANGGYVRHSGSTYTLRKINGGGSQLVYSGDVDEVSEVLEVSMGVMASDSGNLPETSQPLESAAD
jgi:hypothetical protein